AELAEWLVGSGYKRVDAVEYPGEFSRRGGICDVFPPDSADPVRLEFFGDELESIRTFAVASQRSLERKPAVTLPPADAPPSATGSVTDYLPGGSRVALVEPGDLKEQARHFFERVADPTGLFTPDGALASLLR